MIYLLSIKSELERVLNLEQAFTVKVLCDSFETLTSVYFSMYFTSIFLTGMLAI
jgi:hypothetical protein